MNRNVSQGAAAADEDDDDNNPEKIARDQPAHQLASVNKTNNTARARVNTSQLTIHTLTLGSVSMLCTAKKKKERDEVAG